MNNRIVTRFAPSPTNLSRTVNKIEVVKPDGTIEIKEIEDLSGRGAHAGSMRTILYNYVVAKQHKDGLAIIRCEDTDLERSNDECLKCMIRDWEWAGIDFDAGFTMENGEIKQFNNTDIDLGKLRQTERKEIYNKYAKILLDKDMAYEKDGAIFFKMPKEDVKFVDDILGELTLPAKDCMDFVIIKSSGIPSFYFAVTVDDETMGITHILRGQEHINTAFRQVALQKSLGFRTLNMGHIPLIMNPDGSKMSKRQATGQVNVHDFRKDGYINKVLLNYLACLGWNPGNNIEEFDIEFMIKNFRIQDIGKANARFDYKKLANFNSNFIKKQPTESLYSEYLLPYINDFHKDLLNSIKDLPQYKVLYLVDLYKERAKTLLDIVNGIKKFVNKIEYNEKAVQDICGKPENKQLIHNLAQILRAVPDNHWSHVIVNDVLTNYIKTNNLSMNKVAQPLRVATTGDTVSPPIDKTLEALGKTVTIERLDSFLNKM